MPTNDPTIAWVLDRATNINPHGDATIDLGTGERRDWAEVARRVDGVASGLNSIDLDRGDRVGVLMLNSARHLELWFAIPVAGMVMNDLNFRLATEELRFICDDSQVKLLFVDETFLPVARQLRDSVASIHTLVWVGPGTDAPHDTIAYESMVDTAHVELPELESEDLVAIFYTGGTTGLPKGAMLTHRNLTANALHMGLHARITPIDRYLHAAPQFHLADGALAYALTWAGGTHVFVPAFDPAGDHCCARRRTLHDGAARAHHDLDGARAWRPGRCRYLLHAGGAVWRLADARRSSTSGARGVWLRLRAGVRHDRSLAAGELA